MVKYEQSLYDYCKEHPQYLYLLDEWDFKKNSKLGIFPDSIGHGSHTHVWWKCEKGRSWFGPISKRGKKGGCLNCPMNCEKAIIKKVKNNITMTHPDLMKEWDYEKNNQLGLYPESYTMNSSRRVWWKCALGHSWEYEIASRAGGRKGLEGKTYNCPYCENRETLAGFNDIATTHPHLMKEWDYQKNAECGIFPENYRATSWESVWWKCKHGHTWPAAISNRVNDRGCPLCYHHVSRPQAAIYLLLRDKFKSVTCGIKMDGVEFDVYIEDIGLLIEYDGAYFHYNKREKDLIKNKVAVDHNMSFIRVYEHSKHFPVNTPIVFSRDNIYYEFNSNYKIDIPALCYQVLLYLNHNYHLGLPMDIPENICERAVEYCNEVNR